LLEGLVEFDNWLVPTPLPKGDSPVGACPPMVQVAPELPEIPTTWLESLMPWAKLMMSRGAQKI